MRKKCEIKYRLLCAQFGDSQKLRLVRILRSTVMVRVGGGWVALDEFLLKNDPCRGKFLISCKIHCIYFKSKSIGNNFLLMDLENLISIQLKLI